MEKTEILEGLKEVLHMAKPKLVLDNVTLDSNLTTDVGVDSLTMLMMVLGIETKFEMRFDTQEPFTTVGQVVDYIYKAKK